MWSASDITILLHDEMTDDPVVTAEIVTPDGVIWVMAEVQIASRAMTLTNLHTHGDDVGGGEFGARNLMRLIQAVMEAIDVDETVVVGAVRTSGANPGRRPRPLRFTRKVAAPVVRQGISEHA